MHYYSDSLFGKECFFKLFYKSMFWFNVIYHFNSMKNPKFEKKVRVFINAKFEHNSFDVNNDITELSKVVHSLRKIYIQLSNIF